MIMKFIHRAAHALNMNRVDVVTVWYRGETSTFPRCRKCGAVSR